ncbi:MAG: hypothetical protein AAF533_08485 [Acidobacteriota bacterium]
MTRWRSDRWETELYDPPDQAVLELSGTTMVGDRLVVAFVGRGQDCREGQRVAITTLDSESPLRVHRWSLDEARLHDVALTADTDDESGGWPLTAGFLGLVGSDAPSSNPLTVYAVRDEVGEPATLPLRVFKNEDGSVSLSLDAPGS